MPSIESDIVKPPALGFSSTLGPELSEVSRLLLGRIRTGSDIPDGPMIDGINDASSGSTAVGQPGPDLHEGIVLPSRELPHRTGPRIVFINNGTPFADASSAPAEVSEEGFFGQSGSGKSGVVDQIFRDIQRTGPTPGRYARLGGVSNDPIEAQLEPPLPRMDDVIAMLMRGDGALAEYAEVASEVGRLMQEEKAEEDASFISRIAAIGGIQPEDVHEWELKELYRYRMESGMNPFAYPPVRLVNKYVGARATTDEIREQQGKYRREHADATDEEVRIYGEKYRYNQNRARAERFQEWTQLTETLFDIPPVMYSYGLHAPTYSTALMVAEESHPNTRENHRALLVGALTPSTITEFAATVNMVHPTATKLVTDIEGETTAKVDPSVATFVYGDAARLAVADESVDSIHTNILMRNITTQDPASDPHLEFLKDTKRALAPKGQLIMVEPSGDADQIVDLLEKAGYKDIAVLPALRFGTRRAMERTLTFNKIDPPELSTEVAQNETVIIATKQPAGTTKEAIRSGSIKIMPGKE